MANFFFSFFSMLILIFCFSGVLQKGILLDLHLQGAEAGPPRHRSLLQGHGHHELVCQRHLRADRRRVLPPVSVQQKIYHHLPRNPDRRPSAPSGRVGQTRRIWGHQGRHQIHQRQVDFFFFHHVMWPCVVPFSFHRREFILLRLNFVLERSHSASCTDKVQKKLVKCTELKENSLNQIWNQWRKTTWKCFLENSAC